MEPRVFNFSEEELRRRKKRFLILGFIMPVILAILLFFTPLSQGLSLTMLITVLLIVTAIMEIMITMQSRKLLARIRQDSIVLAPEAIERRNTFYYNNESINYNEINHLIVAKTKNDNVLSIKIYSFMATMEIAGFNNMNALSDEIISRFSGNPVILKRTDFSKYESILMLAAFVIITGFSVLILRYGRGVFRLLNGFLMMILGVFLLVSRPLSRNSGMGFKKTESMLGYTMVVMGLINSIRNILWIIKPGS